ncbi:50S ribosomal protein L5 [Acidobacteriota bacterium]
MSTEKNMPRVKERYKQEVMPQMMKEFGYKNTMAVPKLSKIVINIGMGEGKDNIKLIDAALDELSVITGQRGVVTRAKKSIASFKLRKGNPVGCMVTLRSRRMYEFFDRLVSIALPRVGDFRGLTSCLYRSLTRGIFFSVLIELFPIQDTGAFSADSDLFLVIDLVARPRRLAAFRADHLEIRHLYRCFFFHDPTLDVL